MNATQNTRRLQQLRAAIDDTLADPIDPEPRRTCGRLACTVGLLLLDESDDRRVLLLHLLDGAGAAATSSPRKPSEIQPGQASAEATDASTRRCGGAEGRGGVGGSGDMRPFSKDHMHHGFSPLSKKSKKS